MENNERWMELCELAAKEPDPNRLISLTNEIVRLLDEKRNPRNISKTFKTVIEPSVLIRSVARGQERSVNLTLAGHVPQNLSTRPRDYELR